MEAYELGVEALVTALDNRELSAVEVAESCLDRIEKIDSEIGAFITVDRQGARAAAEKADRSRAAGEGGALCGVPVSIKDLLNVKGLRNTCGSKILENYISPYDATVVTSLKQAGAVILGKVSMDEFAMGSASESCAFGVPRNPMKKGYVAGGSSGGSAASVAALFCPASLGSDTGGSIRQPASLCGLVGMKPSYGRVSRYGLTAFASSLDQVGPLTRSVADCARMMQVICGWDEMDSTSVKKEVPQYDRALEDGLAGMKVGVPKEYFTEGIDPEVKTIVENGIEALKTRGADIIEVSLPHTAYCVAAYYLIAPSEASSNLARYDGVGYGVRRQGDDLREMYEKTRSEGFGPEVKRRILIGTYALSSGYYDAYYRKASQVRTLIVNDFNTAFQHCDVLVSPVCPTPAWKIGEHSDDPLAAWLTDILTLSTNLAGVPGISVPGGVTAAGLPVGIQLQGRHFDEETLLKVAFNLEQELQLPVAAPDI